MFLRSLAGLFFILAAFALSYDATHTGAGGAWTFTTLGQYWAEFAPATLASAQALIRTKVHPLAWDPGMRLLLAVPAWAMAAVLGVLFGYFGRQRRRVNIFAN